MVFILTRLLNSKSISTDFINILYLKSTFLPKKLKDIDQPQQSDNIKTSNVIKQIVLNSNELKACRVLVRYDFSIFKTDLDDCTG